LGWGKEKEEAEIFLPNFHRLLNFLIKACHTHSNMLQYNATEFDYNATNKTKGKMFRNSMLDSIIIYEKRIKYSLSEQKQESDVLPPKQENL
jgi:hypothetical protein